MRIVRCLFLTIAAANASLAWTSLVIRTDLECTLTINGKQHGVLRPGLPLTLSDLPAGEHELEVSPTAGGPGWRDTVEVKETGEQVVEIPLKALVVRAEIQSRGYWKDPATQLTWAASDNGSAVSWSQAEHHCRSLVIGGFKDWRLPTIDELQRLSGGSPDDRGYRIIVPLKLTGWAWSSSEGTQSGENWTFDFGDGGRASVVAGDSGLNRALCVRDGKR